jgi:nucleotide-binding universal stress UspA family protein
VAVRGKRAGIWESIEMFKKLLVPLDGTSESAVALPLAGTVAHATGAAVRVLRVVPPKEARADAPVNDGAGAYLVWISHDDAGC